MNYLDNYYNVYDEEQRLLSKHGQVEYITTMKYIHELLKNRNQKIIEIGAGTGRYSVTLAKEGYDVTAVELIKHNIDVLNNKLDGTENIKVYEGNALDLSKFKNNEYDITLVLGPMYHLYNKEDKIKALKETYRITKPNGYILVAYCMNESTIIQYAFMNNNIKQLQEKKMITEDWHCISNPEDLFEMIRLEEINELNKNINVERIKIISTDGATNYLRSTIDNLSDEEFELWVKYHLNTCERIDLIGASNHTLDILKKNDYTFKVASIENREEINDLYNLVRAKKYCVWNDEYPTYFEIDNDLSKENLFILLDNKKIIGAISIEEPSEMEDFPCWKNKTSSSEIARVVIHPDYHNKHLSRLLISNIIEVLKERKIEAIHLAVVKENIPAWKLYQSFNFVVVDEQNMYGHDYHLCELLIK